MKKHLGRVYGKGKTRYFAFLKKRLAENQKTFVVTANPEILVASKKDKEVTALLEHSLTSLVPDGISVVMACNKKGHSVKERIPGVDVCTFLLEEASKQKKTVYLFGAAPDVNRRLVETINKKYPELTILGATHGYVSDRHAVFEKITSLAPDICMVALGVPEQEKLIFRHLDRFEKGIFIGVGGSFDVISGAKPRAPQFFINHNLEWLYRIVKEPNRLKRFLAYNIRFLPYFL